MGVKSDSPWRRAGISDRPIDIGCWSLKYSLSAHEYRVSIRVEQKYRGIDEKGCGWMSTSKVEEAPRHLRRFMASHRIRIDGFACSNFTAK